MPGISHFIYNDPMEGFWGIMGREMYYGRRLLPGNLWSRLSMITWIITPTRESSGILEFYHLRNSMIRSCHRRHEKLPCSSL